MTSFFKNKDSYLKESSAETETIKETISDETLSVCPTCGRKNPQFLGITPEGITVCEACGYKKTDKFGKERVFFKFDKEIVLTHKED